MRSKQVIYFFIGTSRSRALRIESEETCARDLPHPCSLLASSSTSGRRQTRAAPRRTRILSEPCIAMRIRRPPIRVDLLSVSLRSRTGNLLGTEKFDELLEAIPSSCIRDRCGLDCNCPSANRPRVMPSIRLRLRSRLRGYCRYAG